MSVRAVVVGQGYERILRPALFHSYGGDPERIHDAMMRALRVLPHAPDQLQLELPFRHCTSPDLDALVYVARLMQASSEQE